MFFLHTRKWVSFLIVFAMVFSLTSGLVGVAGPGDMWDLSNFIVGAQMYDITDPSAPVPVNPGDPTFIGKTYKFEINFEEETEQLAYTNGNPPHPDGVLVYQLPAALNIQNPIDVTPIRSSTGAIIGWYEIDTNGLVYMWFDDVDENGKPAFNSITGDPENYIDHYTNVEIVLDVFAQLMETGGDIDFGGGIDINIDPPTHPPSSLDVNKTSRYVPATDRIEYMITISALGIPGSTPVDNIKLNDEPTINNLPIGEESAPNNAFSGFRYAVDKVGAPPGYLQPMPVDWTVEVLAGPPSRYDPASFSYDFAGLSLDPGDFITIRYFVDIKQLIANNPSLIPNALDYAFTLDNLVTVSGDSDGVPVPDVTDTTSDPVSKVFPILKQGVLISDPSDPPERIRWTITVGNGVDTELNEGTISDVLDSKLTLPPDNEIAISIFGLDGTGASDLLFGGSAADLSAYYTRGPSPGIAFAFNVPLEDDPIPTGGIFGTIYQVVIVFDTPFSVPPPLQGQPPTVYENKVIFEQGGWEVDDTGKVTLRPEGDTTDITKTTSGICGRPGGTSGEEYWVEYTITVDIPGGLLGERIYLFDTLGVMPSGSGITAPSNIGTSMTITATDPAGTTDFMASLTPSVVSPFYQSNAWAMFFGAITDPNPSNTFWPTDDPVTLTITYTIDIPDDRLAYLQQNLGRALQNAVYLINNGELPRPNLDPVIIPGQDGYNVVVSTNVNDYWPILKTNTPTPGDPALINYTVTIKGDYTQDPGTLFSSSKDPSFSDTFDSRLEYVPGTFYIIDKTTGIRYVPAGDVTVVPGGSTSSFSVNLRDLVLVGGAPPSDANWFAKRDTYEAHYQLRISDEALEYAAENQTPLSLSNTASIEVHPGECKFDSDSTVTYHPPPPPVPIAKTMTPTGSGSSLVDVEIIINPDGSIMFAPVPGEPGPPTITAKDVLTNLMLYTDTIEIYTQTKTGGVWDGVWKDQPYSFNDDALWSVNIINANEVDFVLPNETPVKIEYQALVTLPAGDQGKIGNKISIFGDHGEDGQDNYEVTDSGGGVTASRLNVMVVKRDAATSAMLSGAKFDLYVTYLPGYIPPGGFTSSGTITIPATDGTGGRDFFRLIEGNTTGVLDHAVIVANRDLIFLLVETEAPPGYVLPQGSDAYTFFMVNPTISPAEISAREALLGYPINRISDFITVTNAKGSLAIQKEFYGLAVNERPSNFSIRITGPDGFDETLDLAQAVAGHTYTGLSIGDYTLVEDNLTVPGYSPPQITINGLPATLPHSFSITSADADITITINNSYSPTPPRLGALTIRKVFDGLADSERPSNFLLRITGPNNFNETLSLQQAIAGRVFVSPALGEYTIAEVDFFVPGFNLTHITVNGQPVTLPHSFSVTSANTQITITIANFYSPKPPPPKTGDSSQLWRYIILLIAGVGFMGSAILYRRLWAPKTSPRRKR